MQGRIKTIAWIRWTEGLIKYFKMFRLMKENEEIGLKGEHPLGVMEIIGFEKLKRTF